MIISCVKWGDKFSHEHVNRLYTMCAKHFDDFRFICHTDNSDGIWPLIEIRKLDESLDLEKWWWKLQLFDEDRFRESREGKHLFFDLDVVIQTDPSILLESIEEDKLTMVKAYWKSYPLEQLDMNNNSSVLAWEGDLSYLWRKFTKDPEKYLLMYNGIDGFITHECPDYVTNFDRGIIYSRLYGTDENNCFEPIGDNQPTKFFYEPEYSICIFNGWRREKYPTLIFPDGRYWLDNDAYYGMEHYWESKLRDTNHTGIDRRLWDALWECSYTGGDVNHFLDSLSPNQYESKLWLVENLVKCVHNPKRIQIYGGWFAHPITPILRSAFKNLRWIENIDLDENALHICRLLNDNMDTVHANVLEPGNRDGDVDVVINTSSEHMEPLPVIIANRKYKRYGEHRKPTIFAIQSNNMFHVPDHINCVNNEDELAEMCEFKKVLYKGALDMPNGYKRFMVIGYA